MNLTNAGSALTYGILLGMFGLGAIGGGVANPRLKQHLSNEAIIRLAFAGFALALVILNLATSMVMACLALLLAGGSAGSWRWPCST